MDTKDTLNRAYAYWPGDGIFEILLEGLLAGEAVVQFLRSHEPVHLSGEG